MNLLPLLLATALIFAGAESPFVGKWKVNPEKSQFTGMTLAFEQLQSGEMRATAEGQSYTFRTDGKEYPALFGATAAWKQLDANTWEATYKVKDRVLSTDSMVISPDGASLTLTAKGTKPDGTPFSDTVVYQRVEGGPGIAGKWKTAKVTISSPEMLEFASLEDGGLSLALPAHNASATIKFDGKPYPVQGPTVPPNLVISATSTSPASFEMVQRIGDKVLYRGTYTVSADGRTLTAVFTPEGTNESVTIVYDRQ